MPGSVPDVRTSADGSVVITPYGVIGPVPCRCSPNSSPRPVSRTKIAQLYDLINGGVAAE